MLLNVFAVPEAMRNANNYNDKSSQRKRVSLKEMGLIGQNIRFIKDANVSVRVISDAKVEFEGEKWSLQKLTRELQRRRGKSHSSHYVWPQYWEFDGTKIAELIPDDADVDGVPSIFD